VNAPRLLVLTWNSVLAIVPTVGHDAEKAQAEEERQAKNLIDASKAAGVQHFVWFSLPHSNVPHFEWVLPSHVLWSSSKADMVAM